MIEDCPEVALRFRWQQLVRATLVVGGTDRIRVTGDGIRRQELLVSSTRRRCCA
jgi:hypothetical protein